ncbi:Lcl domain-containing protein [Sulfurimonas sp.]
MTKQTVQYFIIIFLISLLGCSSDPTIQPNAKLQKKESSQHIMYVKVDEKPFYKGEKVTLIAVKDNIAITSKGKIALNKLEKQRSEYKLTIHTSYNDAVIKILNIKPKYHDGIWLKAGKYHIKVTLKKYMPYEKWIQLTKDTDLIVTLKRKPNVSMGFIIWQEMEGVKYIDGSFWQDQAVNKQKQMQWNDAKEYCQNLEIKITNHITLNDFTLPSDSELLALNRHISKLDYVGGIYWSSSTDEQHNKFAKYVYINNKKTGWYSKTGSTYVRCISKKNYPIELSLKDLTAYLIKKNSYNYIDAYELALNLKYGKPVVRNIQKLKKHRMQFTLRSQKYDQDKRYYYYNIQNIKFNKETPTKVKFEVINDKPIFKSVF